MMPHELPSKSSYNVLAVADSSTATAFLYVLNGRLATNSRRTS